MRSAPIILFSLFACIACHYDFDAEKPDAGRETEIQPVGTSGKDGGEPVLMGAECSPGQESACLEGPDGKLIAGLVDGVGACRAGTRRCDKEGRWEACEGAIGPQVRDCDSNLDMDCDGYADNDRSRPDAVCACWEGDARECTSSGSAHCAGTRACVGHQWGACEAPAVCACDSGATRACASGANDCAGGQQTCTSAAWGDCLGAPAFCECMAGQTAACDSLPSAPGCGTAKCSSEGRWDTAACTPKNACGGCAALLSTPGASCDGADEDMCREGTWQCSGGALTCSDTSSGAIEVCDGQDNDCDGSADNAPGFQCVRQEMESCTYRAGECSAPGVRRCSAACAWQTCTALAESTCNRKDDNCDGFADENLLAVAAPSPLTSVEGSVRLVRVADPSPAFDGFFVLFTTENAQMEQKLFGLRVSSKGASIGTPIELASGRYIAADVAWALSDWVVGYYAYTSSNNAELRYVRVAQDGTLTRGTSALYQGSFPTPVQVTGGKVPLVSWTDEGQVYAATLGSAVTVKRLLYVPPSGEAKTYFNYLQTALVEDGRQWAVWVMQQPSNAGTITSSELRYLTVDEGLVVRGNTTLSSVAGSSVLIYDLSYEPSTSRLVGFVFDGTVKRMSHDLAGGAKRELSVVPSVAVSDVLISEKDGSTDLISSSTLTRYDGQTATLRDSAFRTEPFCKDGNGASCYDAALLPESAAERFVVFGSDAQSLRVFFIGCK